MNLVAKVFVIFLAASFALIAYKPDSIATALIPLALCASYCVERYLNSQAKRADDQVNAQLKVLKERLDMLVIQKGLSR